MPLRYIRKFIRTEAAGGIILFVTAVVALILDNSPARVLYEELLKTPFVIKFGDLGLEKPLILWINDGLMTIFFLSVGLEIKREIVAGELSTLNKVSFPAICAIGGIVAPATIYIMFNWGDSYAMKGWAIPTATDIAFALGLLSLLGNRVPFGLKVFVMALAIFDDIGAIIIIAAFYTAHISMPLLLTAGGLLFVLYLLNRNNVAQQEAYFFVGLILWGLVLKSGVHATLAGVAIAFSIPMRIDGQPERSPLKELETRLMPWVAYFVLPAFAFANAGVNFSGIDYHFLFGPIPMGIALGLLIGKQLGIFGFAWIAIKTGFVKMPARTNWLGLYGASIVCGIGFTMSLFIGTLAFTEVGTPHAALVRFGVLAGSVLSGILGYLILYLATRDYTPQATITHNQTSYFDNEPNQHT